MRRIVLALVLPLALMAWAAVLLSNHSQVKAFRTEANRPTPLSDIARATGSTSLRVFEGRLEPRETLPLGTDQNLYLTVSFDQEVKPGAIIAYRQIPVTVINVAAQLDAEVPLLGAAISQPDAELRGFEATSQETITAEHAREALEQADWAQASASQVETAEHLGLATIASRDLARTNRDDAIEQNLSASIAAADATVEAEQAQLAAWNAENAHERAREERRAARDIEPVRIQAQPLIAPSAGTVIHQPGGTIAFAPESTALTAAVAVPAEVAAHLHNGQGASISFGESTLRGSIASIDTTRDASGEFVVHLRVTNPSSLEISDEKVSVRFD
jgi:hypothetical protein